MLISVGSKVFLMGEYLALNGGPALLASVEPRFQMSIKKGDGKLSNISLKSPAGVFYSNNLIFFSKYDIKFIDPYSGAGGWGASSAQFAMLAAFFYGQGTIQADAQWDLDLQQIDQDYLKITSQYTKGLPPSGMDVIVQLRGGLVYIDRNKGHIESVVWPFNDITFLMFATGAKVITHDHLNTLVDLPIAELNESVQKFNNGLMNLIKQDLIESMNSFRNTLLKNNLEAQSTTKWIDKMSSVNGVLAIKGCGALGADVIVLLIEKSAETSVVNALQSFGAQSVVLKEQLTGPLNFTFDRKDCGQEATAL